MRIIKRCLPFIAVLMILIAVLCGCSQMEAGAGQALAGMPGTETEETSARSEESKSTAAEVHKDGVYNTKAEVAAYIHLYGKLPGNYITKKEAQELGWDSREGNLAEAAPGKSIGGGTFGNYEGQLPDKEGRRWYECDIDYEEGYRGAKRIIYSNDGLIYYTEDHYKTFEQLY